MEHAFIYGIMLGMLGALMMNIGKGVQKQYVHIFLAGRGFLRAEHRRTLVLWSLGFLVTASSIFPYTLALKMTKSPACISAMTGIGLTGLGLYAVWVIGEKLSRRDLFGMGLIVVGTSLLGYLGGDQAANVRQLVDTRLALAGFSIVVVAAGICLLSKRLPRIHGIAFGSAAGMAIGLSIFLGDAALVKAGGSLTGQLSNPYPYIALASAASATVITQVGFLKSRAIEVVSAVNSAAILTPLVLELIVYGSIPDFKRLLLIALILTGVIVLSGGAASRIPS